MSDLNQYEIHFNKRTSQGFIPNRVALEWAYSAADALEQFNVREKYKTVEVTEIGPVKQSIQYRSRNIFHFHFCPECCRIGLCSSCYSPEQAEMPALCNECSEKIKHEHSCPICGASFSCKNLYCPAADQKIFPCVNHTKEELKNFLLRGEKPASPEA